MSEYISDDSEELVEDLEEMLALELSARDSTIKSRACAESTVMFEILDGVVGSHDRMIKMLREWIAMEKGEIPLDEVGNG